MTIEERYHARFLILIELLRPNLLPQAKAMLLNQVDTERFLSYELPAGEGLFMADVYMLENLGYETFGAARHDTEALFRKRATALENAQKIAEEGLESILEKSFVINRACRLTHIRWDWTLQNGKGLLDEDLNEALLTEAHSDGRLLPVLLKPSLINPLGYDEVLLLDNDRIIADLWDFDDSFYGYDVLDAVQVSGSYTVRPGLNWKRTVCDFLFKSVVYYHSLLLQNSQ